MSLTLIHFETSCKLERSVSFHMPTLFCLLQFTHTNSIMAFTGNTVRSADVFQIAFGLLFDFYNMLASLRRSEKAMKKCLNVAWLI